MGHTAWPRRALGVEPVKSAGEGGRSALASNVLAMFNSNVLNIGIKKTGSVVGAWKSTEKQRVFRTPKGCRQGSNRDDAPAGQRSSLKGEHRVDVKMTTRRTCPLPMLDRCQAVVDEEVPWGDGKRRRVLASLRQPQAKVITGRVL